MEAIFQRSISSHLYDAHTILCTRSAKTDVTYVVSPNDIWLAVCGLAVIALASLLVVRGVYGSSSTRVLQPLSSALLTHLVLLLPDRGASLDVDFPQYVRCSSRNVYLTRPRELKGQAPPPPPPTLYNS